MSYVVIDLQQKASDAKAIRDYLLEAERVMPQSVQTTRVHLWLSHIATRIDEQAKRRVTQGV